MPWPNGLDMRILSNGAIRMRVQTRGEAYILSRPYHVQFSRRGDFSTKRKQVLAQKDKNK